MLNCLLHWYYSGCSCCPNLHTHLSTYSTAEMDLAVRSYLDIKHVKFARFNGKTLSHVHFE